MPVTQTDTLLPSLLSIRDEMLQAGDEERGRRIGDLARKTKEKPFTLALCGHFSAGKSSMLNALLGKELLPSSPIPTSANLVRIRNGANRVKLTLSTGAIHRYPGAYTPADLKALCKNGEHVIAVEVSQADIPYPAGVEWLDTPGIDSTDEAHRMATESALHLADAIFYVMDYNHVQSELNLQFLRELSQRGKRIYLVINQVDKHREAELSFSLYRKRVEATFAQWELQVEQVFYTTLLQPDHSENEWPQLKVMIDQLITQKEVVGREAIQREAAFLVEEHLAWRERHRQDAVQSRIETLGHPLADEASVHQEEQRLQQEQRDLVHKRASIRTRYMETCNHLIDSAHLTPFTIRELAHSYLETELTPFRVGLFFSRTKTEREKERRFHAFWEPFREAVLTQVDIPLRQRIIQFLKEEGVYTDSIGNRIQEASPPVDSDLLAATIKKGAGLTGDYILKYCADLTQAVKQTYRQWSEPWWQAVHADGVASLERRLAAIDHRLQALQRIKEVYEEMRQSEEAAAAIRHLFQQRLAGVPEGSWKEEWTEWLESKPEEGIVTDPLSSWVETHTTGATEPQLAVTGAEATCEIEPILAHVRHAEAILGDMTGWEGIRDELRAKRHRLEQRRFTVALFGAFSAGKSSFVNALIGEAALPVSPNPTTAAINRITAPDDKHPHNHVVIRYKDEGTLLADLRAIYRLFQRQVDTIDDALAGIDGLLATPSPHPRQRAAFPFLQAVQKGWPSFQRRLGKEEAVGRDTFAQAVATEETACFVEWAELTHDNPLTRAGVTLVDTPGADSIHARHTEVAFRYIKDADAILFVTYYNHAFSRADRAFLNQLGRVKDTFAMDKMFFLMNAADLAASDRERREVEKYLREQLVSFGIRKPRLFPVSSLQALKEKEAGLPGAEAGLLAFEQAFTRFLKLDLAQVALHGMKQEIQRARQLLLRQANASRHDIDERQKQRAALQSEKEALLRLVDAVDGSIDEHALRQEMEELFYYVRQRFHLRLNDTFTEFFHPGALREDRGSVQDQLRACTLEWLDCLRHDLAQELRATGLRVEKWLQQRLETRQNELSNDMSRIHADLSVSTVIDWRWVTPPVPSLFPEVGLEQVQTALSHFKSTKHFFAKNGRAKVREAMKPILLEIVTATLTEERERFLATYTTQWQQAVAEWKSQSANRLRDHFAQLVTLLDSPADPVPLETAAAALEKAFHGMEQELG